jgi:hypothetical protein
MVHFKHRSSEIVQQPHTAPGTAINISIFLQPPAPPIYEMTSPYSAPTPKWLIAPHTPNLLHRSEPSILRNGSAPLILANDYTRHRPPYSEIAQSPNCLHLPEATVLQNGCAPLLVINGCTHSALRTAGNYLDRDILNRPTIKENFTEKGVKVVATVNMLL